MGDGTRFAYQHDARRQPDGTITIFDNGAAPKVHDRSRGIVLELETGRMTATLAREYTSPDQLLSSSQGNVQVLPNGNVFVGWGSAPYLSEFDGEGGLLFNATFPGGDQSYRAFRMKWSGHPTDNPAVAAKSSAGDKVTVYASWNGATEVESWQVLAGPEADRLEPVASPARASRPRSRYKPPGPTWGCGRRTVRAGCSAPSKPSRREGEGGRGTPGLTVAEHPATAPSRSWAPRSVSRSRVVTPRETHLLVGAVSAGRRSGAASTA
jgi:hypothetical protein